MSPTEIPVDAAFLFKVFLASALGALASALWLIIALCRRKRSKTQLGLSILLVCGFVLLSGYVLNSCNGRIAPRHEPHSNVSVCYAFPRIDRNNNAAYFIKSVAQERTAMKFHQLDFSVPRAYWYEASDPLWYRIYLCRSDQYGNNPGVMAEISAERFACPPDFIYVSCAFNWLGINGFDFSSSQQKAAFSLFRQTNSVEILNLKDGVWMTHTLRDPNRPQWGGVIADSDSLRFIAEDSLLLISVGQHVLVTIDSSGRENTRNIEDEIRANGPEDPNIQNLDMQKFIGRPVWNEDQRIIAVNGEVAVLMFDAGLVFQQAIKSAGPAARDFLKQYGWTREGVMNRGNPAGFALANHTITDRTINPDDAATIW